MITTVTLDPWIDMTLRLGRRKPGGTLRAEEARSRMHGRGVGVSIVLRALDQPTVCTGIRCDGNRQQLEDWLEASSLCGRFATAHGQARTRIQIIEKGGVTRIETPGPTVGAAAVEEYMDLLLDCCARSRVAVFTGPVPGGADGGIYRRSLLALKKLPVRTVVDAEGRPLREALRQKPDLIRLSRRTLAETFRLPAADRAACAAAARRLLDRGAGAVCVTMGEEGALLADGDSVWHVPAPVDGAGDREGVGDALVAGLCKGLREEVEPPVLLRYGVAAASAALERGAAIAVRKDFRRLFARTEAVRLDLPPAEEERKRA